LRFVFIQNPPDLFSCGMVKDSEGNQDKLNSEFFEELSKDILQRAFDLSI